jgi:hypothetical protein
MDYCSKAETDGAVPNHMSLVLDYDHEVMLRTNALPTAGAELETTM